MRIERENFDGMKSQITESALRCGGRTLESELADMPHLRFAPIRRQLHEIWRAANRQRRIAGLETAPIEVVPWRRRIVRPFESEKV